VAEVDLLRVREGQRRGREVVGAELREQLARLRPHDAEHAPQRAHVGEKRALVRADVAAGPVGIAHRLGRAGDEQEAIAAGVGRQRDDGEVALEAAALVEHRGVDHGRALAQAGGQA